MHERFPHRHIYADHLGDGHGDNLLNRVALLPSHLAAVVLVPRPHLRAGLLLFLYFDIAQTIWTFWALFSPKTTLASIVIVWKSRKWPWKGLPKLTALAFTQKIGNAQIEGVTFIKVAPLLTSCLNCPDLLSVFVDAPERRTMPLGHILAVVDGLVVELDDHFLGVVAILQYKTFI